MDKGITKDKLIRINEELEASKELNLSEEELIMFLTRPRMEVVDNKPKVIMDVHD